MTVSIEHLQSRLVALLEQVRTERFEDPTLRAEVLLAMNQLCSAGMLLGLWQTLETVGPREEILLVRLIRDLESDRLEDACGELLANPDELVRSVGYGVVALRSRRAGAALIVRAFEREPGIVLKRGGRRHLAPHSFITCMLAGIREFKDKVLDQVAMDGLSRFATGTADLDTIERMLEDPDRPTVARLGFVTLCSRFMGKLHRFAYEEVVSEAPYHLTKRQRSWMARALDLAPEVIEAVAEPGPVGVGDPDFVRARVRLLQQFVKRESSQRIDDLMHGRTVLRSVTIERALGVGDVDESTHESQVLRARSIAYLYAALIGDRRGMAELVDGLKKDGRLEHAMVGRLVELGGEHGALNLATSLVVHWLQLSDEGPELEPFWRWIDGLWTDDRHSAVDDAVNAALQRPDETAIYAARIVGTLGSGLGKLVASLRSGNAIDLSDVTDHVDDPLTVAVARAVMLDDSELHPNAFVALGRAGLVGVAPAFRARLRHEADPMRAEALRRTLSLLDAEELARTHETFRHLDALGLRPVDRELLRGEAAAQVASIEVPDGAALLRVYFWFLDAQLPRPVGARPATGFAAIAEFVVDDAAVLDAHWVDRAGVSHALLELRPRPRPYRKGYAGLTWGTPIETLPDAIDAIGGEVLATVRMQSAVATRVLVALGPSQVRVETDIHGRFYLAVAPIPTATLDEAIRAEREQLGMPLLRTATQAVWRFEGLEVGIRRDPAFDKLARYVRCFD